MKSKRLTEIKGNQIYYKDNTHNELRTPNEMSQDDMYDILNRLAEYEDTGMTPKGINLLKGCYHAICKEYHVNGH